MAFEMSDLFHDAILQFHFFLVIKQKCKGLEPMTSPFTPCSYQRMKHHLTISQYENVWFKTSFAVKTDK